MKAKHFTLFGALILLGACSSSSSGSSGDGEPEDVAGGQSGTDGAGSYYCDLEPHTSADIPLDQSIPSFMSCTAEDAVGLLSTAQAFDCGELGEVELSVGTATAAHQLTGKLYSDTGDPGPGTDCYSLEVDVPVHVAAQDGGVSFDASGFIVGHLCSDYELEGAATDSAGKSWRFRAFVAPGSASLTVSVDEEQSVFCSALPQE